jgi:hypothetical protein
MSENTQPDLMQAGSEPKAPLAGMPESNGKCFCCGRPTYPPEIPGFCYDCEYAAERGGCEHLK